MRVGSLVPLCISCGLFLAACSSSQPVLEDDFEGEMAAEEPTCDWALEK